MVTFIQMAFQSHPEWLESAISDAWICIGLLRSGLADLATLDFYLWGHLKAIVYQEKVQNINHLKEHITHAIASRTQVVSWRTQFAMCFENVTHTEQDDIHTKMDFDVIKSYVWKLMHAHTCRQRHILTLIDARCTLQRGVRSNWRTMLSA